MDEQELIEQLTGGTRPNSVRPTRLLAAIREETISQAELADQTDVSRKTVNQVITELAEEGLITHAIDGYQLTGAGAIALRAYSETVEAVGDEQLALLANSANRRKILRKLQVRQERQADLVAMADLPSRSTVRRTLTTFEEHDLITRSDEGTYQLISAGEHLVQAYDQLEKTYEQVLEKVPCLRDLEPPCADLPAAALENERLVVGKPGNPLKEEDAYLEFLSDLDETETERIRAFSSFYNTRYAEAFLPFMETGTQMDTISPDHALDQIPTDRKDVQIVREGLAADNYHWYVYAGELPAGLVIFDDEWAVLGPKKPSEASTVSGTVYVTDDEVIDWAIALFDAYLEDAHPPMDHLRQQFRQAGANILETLPTD